MHSTLRVIVGIVAVLIFAAGFLVIATGGADAPAGIWALVVGGVRIIAVVLERNRYRSEAAAPSTVIVFGGRPSTAATAVVVPASGPSVSTQAMVGPRSWRVESVIAGAFRPGYSLRAEGDPRP